MIFFSQEKIKKAHSLELSTIEKLIPRTSRLVLTAALLSFHHALQTALTSYYWLLPQLWLNGAYSLGYSSGSTVAPQEGMQDKGDYG